ncbi:molybdopterin molybdotransferase MoeA [Phragmitibacter flavus]|nr:gephyrin-like molybdotransferase Glp [Phragmitibacter flavus]
MLEIETALARILDSVSPLDPIRVPLTSALHHFAARALHATVALPGFDNSAMDGYAVFAADTTTTSPLPIIAEQPAGTSKNLTLNSGTAIRIFTGAPMPEGADAVIMQEDVDLSPDKTHIQCREPVVSGENLRRTGTDICLGQQLLKPGDALTPTRLALLASQGLNEISVIRPPRVAIITTGDELIPAGQPLLPGQLYNSNGILLQSLVAQLGISAISTHHLPDDLDQTISALRELTGTHDFLILSGGVSVGDHDHIKPALQSLGILPNLWRVKIKPGKPLLHARTETNPCQIFGLPGNPVSSYVTYQIFVRPALLKSMGSFQFELPTVPATLNQAVDNPGDRPHYLRGTLQQNTFIPTGVQQSHALFGLSQANAMLRLEANQSLAAGTNVILLVP